MIPPVWNALEGKGIHFQRGQFCLCAAGPGTGKSAFILNMVIKAKVPTLYISADSDAFTQLVRSISIIKGWDLDKSAEVVLSEDLTSVTADLRDKPIRFNYMASPSQDDIEISLESYEEVYGDYPSIIVIDNVTNVIGGSNGDDDPFSGLESLMDYFSGLARTTEACTIGLHHVTGSYNDSDKPIPLSGVKGQITRVPSMVLTLYRSPPVYTGDPDILHVSATKNRGGKSDPSGADHADLEFIGDTMTIRDIS